MIREGHRRKYFWTILRDFAALLRKMAAVMSNVGPQKTHQLITTIGCALLAVSLLFNVYIVWRNIGLHRETQRKAVRLQQIELQVRDWQQLFQELVVYSNKQPAIDPILQKYGLKTATVSSKSR